MSQAEAATANGTKTLPDGWRWVRLGDVCEINPRRQNGLSFPAYRPTTFVPMSAVDERSGRIAQPEVRPFAEVQRGYTYFEEGDVLFAKITPCMQNGKHAIARNLEGGLGFGTTEFHVLRPGHEITSGWIHYFLRQPTLLETATEYFTGAVGQQRLPPAYLADLPIPLAPRHEQERILAVLTERLASVERARSATEAQLEAAKALPAVYLRKEFDSPEAKQWPRKQLEDVCEIVMGQSPEGTSYNAEGRGEPLLNGPTEFGAQYPIAVQWTTAPTRYAEAGDILLCVRGATTGRKNIADKRYCIGRGLAALRGKSGVAITDFLYFSIDVVTSMILSESSGSTFPNIPRDKLAQIEISLPSFADQRRIAEQLAEHMASAERLRQTLAEQLDATNRLPATLLRQAFAGQL